MLDDPEDVPIRIREHRRNPPKILLRLGLLELYPSGLHFLEGFAAIVDTKGDWRVAPRSPFIRPTPWVRRPELPESQFQILPLWADSNVPVAARNVMVCLLLEADLARVVFERLILVPYCERDSRDPWVHAFVLARWEYNIIEVLDAFSFRS